MARFGMNPAGSGELPYVESDGVPRVLACLPPRPGSGGLPKWSASQPTLPRSQWRAVSYARPDLPVLDQGPYGSCVGHGACSGFTLAWLLGGGTFHRLSSCFLYGLINGGRDAGAVVSDAMTTLEATGICLEDEVPEGMIYRSRFPVSAFDTARRFRLSMAYHCRTFDEIGSALQLGFIPVYGIQVGPDFGQLDEEGVAPVGGRGGHCLFGRGMKLSRQGEWLIETQNSWGERFGLHGACYLREAHFGDDCDAFAIQATCEDPQETDLPPSIG